MTSYITCLHRSRHIGVQVRVSPMVLCVVVGCFNRSGREKGVSFFRIPSITHRTAKDKELSTERRAEFLAAISRADVTDKILQNDRICSRHFISGKPASLYDRTNPDWLPTLFLGHSKVKARNVNAVVERHARVRMREIHKRAAMSESESSSPQPESQVLLDETSCVSAENVEEEQLDTLSAEVQTDVTGTDVQILQDELSSAYHEIASLKAALVVPFSEMFMQGNAADVRFYTGLPNSQVVKLVFDFNQPYTKCDGLKLSSFQQFMMVRLKVRMNSPLLDLAHRFGVSQPTVSRVLLRWLTAMDIRLSPLIRWPDRESLRAAMPLCFQESFGKRVAVVIDCFEVFMERPTNLLARACTWSNYKHHNTVKVLLGMTPQGVISFVSDTWGGHVSDKYITENWFY